MTVICAWCPDFNPKDQKHAGVSHGMCPTCFAKMMADLDARELAQAGASQ